MKKELHHAPTHFESEERMALWAGKHVAFLIVSAIFGFQAVGAGVAVYAALLTANYAFQNLHSWDANDSRAQEERSQRNES